MHDQLLEMKKLPSLYHLRIIGILISISSFLWGYSISVLNVCFVQGAIGSLVVDINLTNEEQEFATALVLLGAWMSSFLVDIPNQKYGRKFVMGITDILYMAGALSCAMAIGKPAIYIGRFLIGLACGGVTGAVPVLLTEIAPDFARGEITTLHQLQLTLGILASGLLGYVFVTNIPAGWRYVNGFMVLPALLQLAVLKWIPESPRWLAQKQRHAAVLGALKKLRKGAAIEDIDDEAHGMIEAVKKGKKVQITWSMVFAHKKAMVMGCVLVFFQAMTGINTVILYSSKIFSMAGIHEAIAATASVGTTNVLVTVLSMYLVDSHGRRALLLVGAFLMTISLFILGINLLYLDQIPNVQGTIAVITTLLFVAGFAIGFGAVVWVVLGEVLPTKVRSKAFGLFMAISYLCNIFIAMCTLSIIDALGSGPHAEKNGIGKLYVICGFISLASLVYIYAQVAETKHLSLDDDGHDEYDCKLSQENDTIEKESLLSP